MKRRVGLARPSTEISEAFQKKSHRYLATSRLLVDNNRFEESVTLSYYSMYYALLSLLWKVGIKSESHNASISVLRKVFRMDESKIKEAKATRVEVQYFVDQDVTAQDARELLDKAHDFTAILEAKVAGLVSDDVVNYQNRFRSIYLSEPAIG
jgi:uncharacterized protein (UPF0332 family)